MTWELELSFIQISYSSYRRNIFLVKDYCLLLLQWSKQKRVQCGYYREYIYSFIFLSNFLSMLAFILCVVIHVYCLALYILQIYSMLWIMYLLYTCLCFPPASTVWHWAQALVKIFFPLAADIFLFFYFF